jgi:hypothetical protein
MRDYGKVHTSFWTSATTRGMTENARTLALYLITSPHSTIAGVFRLPDGYVCEDLQWPASTVSEGFAELLSKGFANRCGTTKWVWVCKHLEWNPPENPNQRKSALKIALSVPDECSWKPAFMRVCGPLLGAEEVTSPNPSATVAEPFLNQEQEQEQEQKKPASPAFVLPDWIPAEPWAGYVEMRKKKRAPLTARALQLKVAELLKFKDAGHDIAAVLDKSTANSWTDLYEPKGQPAQKTADIWAGAV